MRQRPLLCRVTEYNGNSHRPLAGWSHTHCLVGAPFVLLSVVLTDQRGLHFLERVPFYSEKGFVWWEGRGVGGKVQTRGRYVSSQVLLDYISKCNWRLSFLSFRKPSSLWVLHGGHSDLLISGQYCCHVSDMSCHFANGLHDRFWRCGRSLWVRQGRVWISPWISPFPWHSSFAGFIF